MIKYIFIIDFFFILNFIFLNKNKYYFILNLQINLYILLNKITFKRKFYLKIAIQILF